MSPQGVFLRCYQWHQLIVQSREKTSKNHQKQSEINYPKTPKFRVKKRVPLVLLSSSIYQIQPIDLLSFSFDEWYLRGKGRLEFGKLSRLSFVIGRPVLLLDNLEVEVLPSDRQYLSEFWILSASWQILVKNVQHHLQSHQKFVEQFCPERFVADPRLWLLKFTLTWQNPDHQIIV